MISLAPFLSAQQCNCGGPNTTVNLWTDDFGTGGRVPSPNANLCYEDGTAATNCGASWAVDDGDYTVHNTTAGVVPWPAWSITNDHTGGGLGRMMIVNASNQGQAFYTIQVPVQPGCDIDVSFWVKNVINAGVANHILPDITLRLLDTLGGIIASVNTGPIAQDEQWYQFALTVNPGVNSAVQISLINNLPPGNGNDFVLDDISMDQTYNIGPTGDFTFQANCSGLTAFTSTASSFTTGYAWDFDNDGVIDDTSPNPSFTYPGSGSYVATLTVDDGLCSYSQTYTVIVPVPPNAGIDSILAICGNAGPTDLFNLLNGTPDAGGTWIDPNGLSTSGIFDASNDPLGSYTYVVPGAIGCPPDSATVLLSLSATAYAGIDGNMSFCSNDPAVQLSSLLGGSPDPGGIWTDMSGNTVGPMFDPATNASGTYTYLVPAINACGADSSTVSIQVNILPDAGSNGVLALCSIDPSLPLFNALGGTPDNGGIWTDPSNAAFSGSLNPSIASSGSYTYTVAGTAPCPDESATVTVSINTAPYPGIDGTITLCSSYAVVQLDAYLSGTPDTGGTWTDPNGNVFPGALDPSIGTAGVYTYTVTGTAPCADESATVTVTINTLPDAGIDSAVSLCSSDAVVQLDTFLGGSPDAGGIWSDPVNAAFNGLLNPSTASSGSYTYTVTGTAPCPDASAVMSVSIDPASNAGINDSLAICFESDPINLFDYLGGQADNSGVWTDAQGVIFDGTFDVLVDSPGIFTYVTLGTGVCPNDTALISVSNSSNHVVAGFMVSTSTLTSNDPAIYFTNTSQQATAYFWDFSGLGSSSANNPSFVFPTALGDTYEVCLYAWNDFGCADTVCKEIVSLDALDVWVPNAFTPEGTGINETFGPIFNGTWVADYEFLIFNRWGELLFGSEDPFMPWDGTYNGTPVADGVYVWRLACRDTRTNERKDLMGHVLLMR